MSQATVETTRDASTCEEPLHGERCIFVEIGLPFALAIHVPWHVFVLHIQFSVQILARHVVLRQLIHVAETPEAIAPSQGSVVVEHEPTSRTLSILKFVDTQRTSVYPVPFVSYCSEGLACLRFETSFEESASFRVFVGLVLLHNFCLFLLPLVVLLHCLA
jgi:hypothetical protein